MKRRIRLSERDLHRVIKESVKRILREQEEQEKYYWSISELRPSSANNGEFESYACVEDSATSNDATQDCFATPDEAYSDGLEQLKYYDNGDYALEVYHFINGAGDYVSGYFAEIHNGVLKEY